MRPSLISLLILTLSMPLFGGIAAASAEEQPTETEAAGEAQEKQNSDEISTTGFEVPPVSYDVDTLPFPTRRMRELILEATRAGDIEKLRLYIGVGEGRTQISLGGFSGDPVEFLKQQSGDKDGHEILAILEEVLEAGFVRLDAGTDREMFVWPYFFATPLDSLSDRQKVELFRIVTYGDFRTWRTLAAIYSIGSESLRPVVGSSLSPEIKRCTGKS